MEFKIKKLMHPEIEKLINLALADGQITEKERNVILKKATELGIDADEVEMTLDGKLHQLEGNKPKQKDKTGIIKKCPACGAATKAFSKSCDACGNEFRFDSPSAFSSKNDISNMSIPFNKEALIEFITFSIGSVKNKGLSLDIRLAWNAKMEEAFLKSEEILTQSEYDKFKNKFEEIIEEATHILEQDTPESQQEIEEPVEEEEEEEKKNWIQLFVKGWLNNFLGLGFAYLIVSIIARLFGAHLWPF